MPITVLPSVDLPQPLSPTSPSVSPGHTASDTPSTALSQPTRRPNALRSGKWRTRSLELEQRRRRAHASAPRGASTGWWQRTACALGERARGRPARAAFRGGVVAARVEPAARRRRDQARHLAADVPDLAARARHAREEAPRVRMRRAREERVGRRRLHLLAGVHHDHAIADLVRGAEIVRGEEHRHPALLHELAQQPEDLRLDRHVERGGGLVRDDEVRPRQQRHRDHQPLALAAGELVRQPAQARAPARGSAPRAACRARRRGPRGSARADSGGAARARRRRRRATRGDFHFIRSMICVLDREHRAERA